MLLSKAAETARDILDQFGIADPLSLAALSMKDLVQARGCYYEETLMDNKDGRIVTFSRRSVISINNSIKDIGKKRFVTAHELGHFELHKHLVVNADSHFDLCNWFQAGHHEKEANEFASELLMPTRMFKEQCSERKFGPDLIEYLSRTFVVSKTAAILRFVKEGNHPVCVFCSQDNKVKWWQMSKDMETMEHDFIDHEKWSRYKIGVSSKFPPPPESVAGQLMSDPKKGQNISRFQEIDKSTWFYTLPEDNPMMYEYCNFIPAYNFALSVVWAD